MSLAQSPSQQFCVGKIDAGIAVLISDSVHLIEFPSLLLPAGVGPGSIVNISCTRNLAAEDHAVAASLTLQESILAEFGSSEPQPPRLRVKGVTQTAVTLEWDRLVLEQAKCLELAVFRNGIRVTTIPSPLTTTSTKLSGLKVDTDYTFHLTLKTSAGTYTSAVLKTRTHTISDTSGISVCFGPIEPRVQDDVKRAVAAMGAKWGDRLEIDTTHFITSITATSASALSVDHQRALQLSIPILSPEWVLACAREKKMVPIATYYASSPSSSSSNVVNGAISSNANFATGSTTNISTGASGGGRDLMKPSTLRRTSSIVPATATPPPPTPPIIQPTLPALSTSTSASSSEPASPAAAPSIPIPQRSELEEEAEQPEAPFTATTPVQAEVPALHDAKGVAAELVVEEEDLDGMEELALGPDEPKKPDEDETVGDASMEEVGL